MIINLMYIWNKVEYTHIWFQAISNFCMFANLLSLICDTSARKVLLL